MIISAFFFFLLPDLTTYDTVKHYLVLNTPLEDNIMTHGLSR